MHIQPWRTGDTAQRASTLAMLIQANGLPYHYLPQFKPQTRAELALAQVEAAVARAGVAFTVLNDNNAVQAVGAALPSPFDTELFGVRIGRLTALEAVGEYAEQRAYKTALLAQLLEQLPDLASLHAKRRLCDRAGLHTLEAAGFYCAAGWIDYGLCPDRWEPFRRKPPCFVRHARATDVPLLEQLAGKAFTLDRFHSDPRLSSIRADQLHRRWVRNSVDGEQAQVVLVAEDDNNEPVGFLTYNYHDEDPDTLEGVRVANVILNATREDYRGRGVYTQLLTECILDCQGRVDFLHVETQTNNVEVQRVWANLGLRPIDAGLSLHWYREA